MSESAAEPADPEGVPLQLRDGLLWDPSRGVDTEFPVGALSFGPEEAKKSTAVIAICEVGERVLVAVPSSAWHRTAKHRRLPPGALVRPGAVAVAGCSLADRAVQSEVSLRVWIGFLDGALEGAVSFDEVDLATTDHPFLTEGGEDGSLPWAEALVAVAEEKFAFTTAASQESSTERRFASLEQTMAAIQASLAQLQPAASASQPKAAAQKPSPPVARPAAAAVGRGTPLGLDPVVVASARQAGIPEDHLVQLGSLLSSGRPKLADVPVQKAKLDVLGEEVDQAEQLFEEGAEGDGSADPLSAAVVKLTSIVELLTKRKAPQNLEEVLADSHTSFPEQSATSSSSQGRRQSAVLKALQRALLHQPDTVYRTIESLMVQDFSSRAVGAGEPAVGGTFRGWLEFRSHIPNIKGTVRTAWAVAGALDSLRDGRIAEGKARLALLLAQLDQVAVDRGQWLIAAEASLETTSPPFAAFSRHMLPDPAEHQFSRLLEPTWVEAFLWRLREVEEYVERRDRLGRQRKSAREPQDDPTGGGCGKGAGKGKGKGGRGGEEPPTPQK